MLESVEVLAHLIDLFFNLFIKFYMAELNKEDFEYIEPQLNPGSAGNASSEAVPAEPMQKLKSFKQVTNRTKSKASYKDQKEEAKKKERP